MSGLQGGFTLLELLVVLVIAGMLFSLVPPLLSSAMPGLNARVAAYDIAAELREVRNRAVAESRSIEVRFDLDNDRADIGARSIELRSDVAYELLEAGSYRVTGNAGQGPFTLRFYPDGSSSGMRMRLGGERRGYDIAVGWLLGRIAVAEVQNDAS